MLCTLGGAVYFLYALNGVMTALLLVLVGSAAPLLGKAGGDGTHLFQAVADAISPVPTSTLWRKIGAWTLAAISVALTVHATYMIAGAATDLSIRSPWDVVPPNAFAVLFLSFAAAATSALVAAHSGAAVAAFAPLAGLGVSIATLAYKIGFGFDPFIHQATERAIMLQGAVFPKPFYYLGHYALVTTTARVTELPVGLIDSWTAPALLALAMPAAYWAVRRATDASAGSAALAAGAAMLLLPLSAFVPSTPQGHANIWFVMTSFLALPALVKKAFPKRLLVLFALAACVVHPLAGIPLLILVAFTIVAAVFEERRGTLNDAGRLFLMAQLVIFGSIAMPAVFVLHSLVAGGGAQLNAEMLANPLRILDAVLAFESTARRYIAELDIAYAWRALRSPLFIALAVGGTMLARKKSRGAMVHVAAAVVLYANYVLLKTVIDFPFLISYERASYAARLTDLALVTLAAPAAVALVEGLERLRKSTATARLAVPLLFAVAATASFYVAYPRRDRFENSRGWSTGAVDVATVQSIEKDAVGKPYLVLANQAVSAAAIREYGFAHYYSSKNPKYPDEVFFYPVPTGGALYEIFLAMNDAGGSRKLATKAMDLAGVDTVYYAVSKYWWDAYRITVAARKNADKSWAIGEDVYIFKYVRK